MNVLINRLLNEATAPIEKMGTGLLKQAYERSRRELRGARLLRRLCLSHYQLEHVTLSLDDAAAARI